MPENPGKEKIRKLVDNIHNGKYGIPNFQRKFEWEPSMVSDLFDSILQGYYTGLLLFWELNSEKSRREMWKPIWGAPASSNPAAAVLDGQQRLSSLYYAIYNPNETFPSRESYYRFFLDMDKAIGEKHYNGAVFYKYSSNYHSLDHLKKQKNRWIKEGVIPLAILQDEKYLSSDEFSAWLEEYTRQRKDSNSFKKKNFSSLTVNGELRKILNYEFVVNELSQDRNMRDVCTIFARINQKGMRLSTFDLMNAFLYPKGFELRNEWENLDNEELKDVDSKMNEQLLKLISLHKQGYCSTKYIYNLIPEEKTQKKDLSGNIVEEVLLKDANEFRKFWRKACKYAEKARMKIMNTGDFDFGAIKPGFIPNTTILPVLGAIMWERDSNRSGRHVSDKKFEEMLNKWYWSAVFSEDYSGSSDSMMAEDFRDWKKWLIKKDNIRRIANLNERVFKEGLSLRATKKNSSRYNAILCTLALNNVKDFFTMRTLDTGDFSDDKINDHHIFPRKAQGLSSKKSKEFKGNKDSILNRTLLLDETNKHLIGNKKPSQYLKKMEENHGANKVREELHKHFISDKAFACMKKDDFDGFIEEREKTILKQIMIKLKLEKQGEETLISPRTPFSNRVRLKDLLKVCQGYIYWVDKYFSKSGLEGLSNAVKDLNEFSAKEVKILVSIKKVTPELRKDLKNLKKEFSKKEVKIEMRVISCSKIEAEIHDRFIISENKVFNIPSTDTFRRGQYSEINETKNRVPFKDWWEESLDIIEDWSKIEKIKFKNKKRN